jgi:hypothetical protein
VGSCFKCLFERDTIVQSEFEFYGWFKKYNFLSFEIVSMCPLDHYGKHYAQGG